jgi:hypothetical protein
VPKQIYKGVIILEEYVKMGYRQLKKEKITMTTKIKTMVLAVFVSKYRCE